MTITEAKKIIEMCADAVKKGDGDDAKIYVNKEYVLSILDMVESVPSGFQPGIEPITTPVWPPTWPQVWYKDSTGEPESPGPGFEKVPWWVWYKNPMGDFTCDSNSTGSKPQDADVVVTSASGHVDDSEPTHLFKEKFTTTGPIRDTSEGTHTI
jgi:hypothetical protein